MFGARLTPVKRMLDNFVCLSLSTLSLSLYAKWKKRLLMFAVSSLLPP